MCLFTVTFQKNSLKKIKKKTAKNKKKITSKNPLLTSRQYKISEISNLNASYVPERKNSKFCEHNNPLTHPPMTVYFIFFFSFHFWPLFSSFLLFSIFFLFCPLFPLFFSSIFYFHFWPLFSSFSFFYSSLRFYFHNFLLNFIIIYLILIILLLN